MAEASSNQELRAGEALCLVTQLDNKDTLDIKCERKIRVQELIDQVYKLLNLDEEEKEYFSLFYESQPRAAKGQEAQSDWKQEKVFLDPAKLAKDQIPNGKDTSIWKIKFGVKFYVSSPATMLRSDSTRSLFCWQLCDDIRSNRVLVDREGAMRLTALMLQAHLGNYDPKEHHTGYCFQSPQFLLLPERHQPGNYEDQIVELHKAKMGYNPEQAESEFLELASKLPHYGMHQYAVEDKTVVVGNSFRGVCVFRKEGERCYEWPNIVKISYKAHKVYIRYLEHDGVVSVNKLHCADKRNAKMIWKNAVDQHTFFRLARVEQPKKVSVMLGLSRRPSVRRTLKQIRAREEESAKREGSVEQTSPSKSTRVIAPSKPHPTPEAVFDIGKQQPNDDNWVLLEGPPVPKVPGDADKFEEQQVVLNFHHVEQLGGDEASKYTIRCHNGSYKIEGAQPEPQDTNYSLHKLRDDATTATTMVSVLIDLKRQRDATAPPVEIFNSARLPVVKISATDAAVDSVTTATVVESNGGEAVSSGEVTQFSLSKAFDPYVLADDASYEAQQVHLFLEREAEIFRSVAEPASFQVTTAAMYNAMQYKRDGAMSDLSTVAISIAIALCYTIAA